MTISPMIVNGVQAMLWVVFMIIDYSLWLPNLFYQDLLKKRGADGQPQHAKKTVVIVGGSFAGLAALRDLQKHNENGLYRVILIEQRQYFEYTPGVLRLFCEPSLFSTLIHPLPTSNDYTILNGTVTQTNKTYVTFVDGQTKKGQSIPFDYLIMATGSSYNYPITPSTTETTIQSRVNGWTASAKQVDEAKSILVLGGGAVGTELAAEIACYYNNNPSTKKQISLVDMESTLVPMFPKATADYATKWLTSNGVTLRLGQKLQSWHEKGCILSNGEILKADLVFVCFGMKPNSSFPAAAAAAQQQQQQPVVETENNPIKLNPRKYIQVDDYLRVDGQHNIFSVGDVAAPPREGIKQAFHAEVMGHIVGMNVHRTISGQQKLIKYPDGASGTNYLPLVFVLSLGRWDGVVGFNELCIPGPIAPIIKWLLEWTKIRAILGRPVGTLIWIIGDAVTFFLSRTLLLPAKLQKSA